MAEDFSFRVKNTIVVNGAFVANSTVVNAAAINATSINVSTINTSSINASSANIVTINASSINLSSANIVTINASSTNSVSIFVGGVNVNTMISGNATTAFTNATTFAANASNITNGTLPNARLSSSIVNTSAAFTMGGVQTYNANIVIGSTAGIIANGSIGTAGQVLLSNGSSTYWGAPTTAVRQTFTATGGQLTFTVSGGYTPNLLDVFYNGVKLINGTEVTATNGTTVVLASGAANGATIDVVGYTGGTLNIVNAVARSGDTMTGALSLPSNGLTVGTTQLAVSGGNVGIGTGSPAVALDVISPSIRVASSGGSGYGLIRLGQSGTATQNWHYGSEGDGTYRWYNGNFGSGTERMRLDSAGNVTVTGGGISTTTGTISSGTGTAGEKQFRLHNAARLVYFFLNDSSTCGLYDASGAFTRWSSDASGNFTAAGNITAYSDETLKANIQTIDNALDTVVKLRGVRYRRKDNGEFGIGVVAQEVQQHVPEVVHTNEDSLLSVSYGNMVGLLIEAMKEQQEKITSLESKINSLMEGSV